MAEAVPTAGRIAGPPSRQAVGVRGWLSLAIGSLTRAPRLGAVVALVAGGLALAGWVLGSDGLKSIVPGTITMKANSAVAFVLLGAGLWLSDGAAAGRARTAGHALAVAAAVLGGVVGVQYLVGRDLGVDQLLFREAPGAVGTIHPGRMAPQTALSFVLLGLALAVADRPRARGLVLGLAAIPIALAALNMLDALFGAEAPTFLAAYSQMPLPTAVAFAALGVGTMGLLREEAPFAALKGSGPGPVLARRLLLASLVIPVVVGWLRLEGQRRGLYDTAYGVSITTLVTIVLFAIVILLTARHLDRADARRRVAEERLHESRLEAERARHEAEQASHAKSDFLSRMSHELRTPLNSVLGFAQLLSMDELPEAQRESVDQIRRAGRHLLQLINEVLDIARIEAGQLSLSIEPVEVRPLLDESVALVQPLAAERGIHLEREPVDAVVMADHHRLRQVVLNLLSNAVKYDRPGGRVVVFTALEGEGRCRILVSDTGPGLAQDQLDRLFVPFERVGAEQSDVEGTGIGLALSRRLAEAMGGTIGVRSEPGKGSTFWVELARAEATLDAGLEPPQPADAPALAEGGTRTVLYVEDNPANVRLMERIIERQPGVRLLVAGHGRLGLDLARQHRPAVVLLDLNLPDISGEKVLAQLRADPSLRSLPVVVISADATPGQIARLRDAGADEYLTKPLDVARLLEVLHRSLADGSPSV